MSEDPFSLGFKSVADFWSKAAQQAQQTAAASLTEAMKGWSAPALANGSVPAVDTEGLNRASEALAQLWRSAGELSTTMVQSFLGASTPGHGATLEPTVEATFRTMADPRSWLVGAGGMDSVVGAMAQGPQLADLWQAERQQAKVTQAWTEMRRRVLEHNAVVMQGWLQAARIYGEEVAGRAKADGRALDHGAAMALWTGTANRVLLEMQRTEGFLQTQAAMIRSGAEFKLAQRDLAERWAVEFGLPSRTELDDVHRSLTELRREFRAYKRKQEAPTAAGPGRARQRA